MGETAAAPGRRFPLPAIPALAAFLVYARTLSFGLVWDDPKLLSWIAAVVSDGGLSGLLRADFRLGAAMPMGYYRPVVLLSLWLDSLAAGAFPGVFHLTNTLLHTLNAALVCVLLKTVSGSSRAALAGSLFFALTPVSCEAVAFTSARTDLWAALFVLVAAIAWERERLSGAARSWPAISIGLVSFTLAILSKEVAFLLPPVLLAWEVVRSPSVEGGRRVWLRRRWPWLLGWSLSTAGVLLLRTTVVGVGLGYREEGAPQGLLGLAGFVARILVADFRLLTAPWPLNAYYTAGEVPITPLATAAALVALSIYYAAAGRSRGRLGILALAWTLGFLLPTLKIVPISGAVIAERYLYLPAAGFALALGTLVDRLAARPRWGAPVLAASLALGGLLTAGTLARQAVWRDGIHLFKHLAQASPAYLHSRFDLGNALVEAGRYEEAVESFEDALRFMPNDAQAHNNLGAAYLRMGRPEEAAASFQAAARVAPGYAEPRYNLANVRQEAGRLREAEALYAEAIRLKPDFAEAYSGLGILAARMGRYREAAGLLLQATKLKPGLPDVQYNLDAVNRALGQAPGTVPARAGTAGGAR